MPLVTDSGDIKSNETLFDIIEYLKDHEDVRITDIAEEIGVSNSTVHRHLSSLRKREYLNKKDGRYVLSHKFLDIGGKTRYRREEYTKIKSRVSEIANETQEIATFIVEEHGKCVFLFRRRGAKAVRTDIRVGSRVDLLDICAGRVILAYAPPQEKHRILESLDIDRDSEEWANLQQELEQVREQEFALDREQYIEGLRAISAPVHDDRGEFLGVISIAGPTHRLRGERFTRELPNYILSVINEYELDIRYA